MTERRTCAILSPNMRSKVFALTHLTKHLLQLSLLEVVRNERNGLKEQMHEQEKNLKNQIDHLSSQLEEVAVQNQMLKVLALLGYWVDRKVCLGRQERSER